MEGKIIAYNQDLITIIDIIIIIIIIYIRTRKLNIASFKTSFHSHVYVCTWNNFYHSQKKVVIGVLIILTS